MCSSPTPGNKHFCYKTGMQVAFEVGGPKASHFGRPWSGILQAALGARTRAHGRSCGLADDCTMTACLRADWLMIG